jgi:hypothetical protein
MGGTMVPVERRQCPPEFQERLTQAVGMNRYGEPNFIIAWGQTRTYTAGGVWPKPQGDGHFGYRQLMLSNSSPSGRGVPCWMILEWHPPEDYETDAVYYFRNRDDTTGLQILGEYPYKGRYEIAFKLTSTEFLNGRLEVQHYHLDGMILDVLIPAIVEGQRMTQRQRLEKLRKWEETKDREMENKIDAVLSNKRRALLPSQIDDRVRLIQRQMGEMLKTFGRVQPGFKINNLAV